MNPTEIKKVLQDFSHHVNVKAGEPLVIPSDIETFLSTLDPLSHLFGSPLSQIEDMVEGVKGKELRKNPRLEERRKSISPAVKDRIMRRSIIVEIDLLREVLQKEARSIYNTYTIADSMVEDMIKEIETRASTVPEIPPLAAMPSDAKYKGCGHEFYRYDINDMRVCRVCGKVLDHA